jgi:hypothetical protein
VESVRFISWRYLLPINPLWICTHNTPLDYSQWFPNWLQIVDYLRSRIQLAQCFPWRSACWDVWRRLGTFGQEWWLAYCPIRGMLIAVADNHARLNISSFRTGLFSGYLSNFCVGPQKRWYRWSSVLLVFSVHTFHSGNIIQFRSIVMKFGWFVRSGIF